MRAQPQSRPSSGTLGRAPRQSPQPKGEHRVDDRAAFRDAPRIQLPDRFLHVGCGREAVPLDQRRPGCRPAFAGHRHEVPPLGPALDRIPEEVEGRRLVGERGGDRRFEVLGPSGPGRYVEQLVGDLLGVVRAASAGVDGRTRRLMVETAARSSEPVHEEPLEIGPSSSGFADLKNAPSRSSKMLMRRCLLLPAKMYDTCLCACILDLIALSSETPSREAISWNSSNTTTMRFPLFLASSSGMSSMSWISGTLGSPTENSTPGSPLSLMTSLSLEPLVNYHTLR